MNLSFGITYKDLYSNSGLAKIDSLFLDFLEKENKNLFNYLKNARASKQEILDSTNLIKLSKALEKFIAKIFNVEEELAEYLKNRKYSQNLYEVKRNFIHRYAIKKYKKEDLNQKKASEDFVRLTNRSETDIDALFIETLNKFSPETAEYEILARFAASRIFFGPASPLFSKPAKIDFSNLVEFSREKNLIWQNQAKIPPNSKEYAYLESSYCINCHKTEKDSCSSGIKSGDNFAINPLGNILSGCPLKIKISEMNEVFSQGNLISSLAIIAIDNPMLALTGARICNDCSKACIFQKQEPVDIPSIESQILKDVLSLPYGFEIYSLLIMWQALTPKDFLPTNIKNKKILVVGSGPAGIALSHYLTRAGCEIIAIDGLKIEKLPKDIIEHPVQKFTEIENLYHSIKPQGFGGVAEYGITDRWNKINLIIARLLLEKRKNFEIYGSVKFGSSLTYSDAKDEGFLHIALCCGSGYPKLPIIKNIDAAGVRSASDFLMSINLGALLEENSQTNFMLSLPALVIGGGLTAIDSAVEITKYYPVLAKKIYKKLSGQKLDFLNKREQIQAKSLIAAGAKYLEEENLAKIEQRNVNFAKITEEFGGVKICYRKIIEQSPAYRINHKELEDALNHGVKILEITDILEIEKDEFGCCKKLKISRNKEIEYIEAKSIFFATGSTPLSIHDATNEDIIHPDISIFGDMDPNYSGSVVKAIASAKNGYKKILHSI